MALPALSDELSPGPVASIAAVLRTYMSELQTLCFLDNEHGDDTNAHLHLTRRVLLPAARRLSRASKGVTLTGLRIDKVRLHTVVVDYWLPDDGRTHHAHYLVFRPSDRARAQERKAEQEGEAWERGAPRRGGKMLKPPRKPRLCASAGRA